MAKELWTVAQAAEALSVSEDTVRRLINGGQLPAYQITAQTTRLDPLTFTPISTRAKRRPRPCSGRPAFGSRRRSAAG